MRGVNDWLLLHPDTAAAIATIFLTIFAAVQILLEIARHRDRRHSAAIEAQGPAWLARRSMEASMREATRVAPFDWARNMSPEPLERLQQQMLETLRLASIAGGKYARAGRRAFTAFIAIADRINTVNTLPPAAMRRSLGGTAIVALDTDRANTLVGEAFEHLDSAVSGLSVIAPRQPDEGTLPKRAEVFLHANGRVTA